MGLISLEDIYYRRLLCFKNKLFIKMCWSLKELLLFMVVVVNEADSPVSDLNERLI